MTKEANKPVIRAVTPSTLGVPKVSMNKKLFDGTIYNQGYKLYRDRAIKCPCKSKGILNHLATCKNCGSTGWVFINRTEIAGIVYSMSWENSYKEWSEENLGNVYITVRDEDKLSFMDRVTIVDAETIHKQVIYPFEFKSKVIAFTTYSIKRIEDAFIFVEDDKPLRRLIEGTDFTIGSGNIQESCNGLSDNIITFSAEILQMLRAQKPVHISIDYVHPPQYHITHLMRDAMVSVQFDNQAVRMPINAVGRRSHYVLDAENYIGDRLFDNSYNSSSSTCTT